MIQIIEMPNGQWSAHDGTFSELYGSYEEALMGTRQTAAQAFSELHGTMRGDAQALIRKADTIRDLLAANPQVAAAAQAAEPGAPIGDTGMVKEEVLMGIALINGFLVYVETEIAPGITVRQAVYRLG